MFSTRRREYIGFPFNYTQGYPLFLWVTSFISSRFLSSAAYSIKKFFMLSMAHDKFDLAFLKATWEARGVKSSYSDRLIVVNTNSLSCQNSIICINVPVFALSIKPSLIQLFAQKRKLNVLIIYLYRNFFQAVVVFRH